MLEINKKRIIVTFLMHLGDLTLTTPFLHVLRKAAPDAHIAYLVDEKLKDVILNNPNIDEVLTIDKKGKDNNLNGIIRTSKKISNKKFDVLINLHPSERCSLINLFAKVPIKVGVSHFLVRPYMTKVLELNKKMHAADMYIDALAQIGVIDLTNNGLEIFTSDEQRKFVAEFWKLQNLNKEDKLIGFNIGSAISTKRWESERFAQVADALAANGYRTVFFGGTMDEEMVKEATTFMKTKPIIATGSFTIGQLAAAMKRCSLIITNDSGPMHVAISQNVPVVALYGPSKPDLYGPYTKNAVVVMAEPSCKGCSKHMKHKCDDMQCMKRISVEQVLSAVNKLI